MKSIMSRMMRSVVITALVALFLTGLSLSAESAWAESVSPREATVQVRGPRNAPDDHLVRVVKTTSGNSDSFVTCPAGYEILSGGFKGNKDFNVFKNIRAGNGWRVKGKAFHGGSSTRTVYALCIDDAFDLEYVTLDWVIPGHINTGIGPQCPPDYQVVAGGYAFNFSGVASIDDVRILHNLHSGNAWHGSLINSTDQARKLKVTAVCILTLELNQNYPSATLPVPGLSKGKYTYKCAMPNFFEMIGGGFLTPTHRVIASYPVDAGTKWRTSFYNISGTEEDAFPAATCAELAAL